MASVTAADTFAVHRQLGRSATDRRFSRWAEVEGVAQPNVPYHRALDWLETHNLGPTMRDNLLFADGTVVDIVRAVFQRSRFTRKRLDVARRVFEETSTPYPAEVEAMISDLTQQLNSINEDAALSDVRQRIVMACRSPEQGAALADELDRVIGLTRDKDRVAANVAMLAQSFDAALAAQEAEHNTMSKPWSTDQENTAWRAVRAWSQGMLAEHLADDTTHRKLAKLFDVKDDDRRLIDILSEYFEEAEKTRDLAEVI